MLNIYDCGNQGHALCRISMVVVIKGMLHVEYLWLW